MLDPREKDYLISKLAPKLRGVNAPDVLALMVGDATFMENFPILTTGEEIADKAIGRAMESGKANNPPWAWLAGLIQSVLYGAVAVDPLLTPVLQRIASAQAAAAAPMAPGVSLFQTRKLFANVAFLDREPCRLKLQDLHTATGKAVLSIEGPPKSGKSHSAELIDYVWQMETADRFEAIRFSMTRNKILSVKDLEEEITGRIETAAPRPRPDPNATTPAAFLQALGRWILEYLRKSHCKWWLVFDNCNEQTLDSDALVVAKFLVEQPLSGAARNFLRVVVIDSPALVEPVADHLFVDREVIPGLQFQDKHFREYYESVLYPNSPPDPEQVEARWKPAWTKWMSCSSQPECLEKLKHILAESLR
jgi:hypothetical protein